MDCVKIGQLIFALRKDKGYTQQQLADLLNISNKTISKWECGAGCPDVSLWPQLSSVLGVEIQKILEGKLEHNKPDVGRMDRTKFYVCPHCGNILTSTGHANISCCGRRLIPQVAAEASFPHLLKIEEIDINSFVSIEHEMAKDNYISFVALVSYDRVLIVRLYPEQDAQARLPLLRKGDTLFFYCMKDGLFKQRV
jgi:DNA-binding XRE family transcriptional regulator/desulfoferrodoxin (superoxide reductase-like protein)